VETLTKEQAFKAMVIFLEGFYERTQSDDVGGLLADMMLRENGTTEFPASCNLSLIHRGLIGQFTIEFI
jgi:hypothetical protein